MATGGLPLLAYLARSLVDEAPAADALVDQIVGDSEAYIGRLTDAGLLKPSAQPHTSAVVLTLWPLGLLALDRHSQRLIGVDMTDIESAPEALAGYVTTMLELVGPGLLARPCLSTWRRQPDGPHGRRPDMAPAIRTAGLTKDYGRVRALDGLDLEVGRGEVVGFLGPNGAGKSTTIRLLLDLLRPTAGTVEVLGADPRTGGAPLRSRIGYLPGELSLPGRRTAGEYLTYLAAPTRPRSRPPDAGTTPRPPRSWWT